MGVCGNFSNEMLVSIRLCAYTHFMRDASSVPDGLDEQGRPVWCFNDLREVQDFLDAEEARRAKGEPA